MKNLRNGFIMAVIAIIALVFTFTACSKSGSSGGGGKSINSATELKEYLDKQLVSCPDKPIKVSMIVNDMMIENVMRVIENAGKYVSLNLSGSPLTEIPDSSFRDCTPLVDITIPNSVTRIGHLAFYKTGLTSVTIPNSVTFIDGSAFQYCESLTNVTIPNSVTSIDDSAFDPCSSLISVTFQGIIDSDNLGTSYVGRYDSWVTSPFTGDLRDKYLAGGIGTYTTTAPVGNDSKWTKQ